MKKARLYLVRLPIISIVVFLICCIIAAIIYPGSHKEIIEYKSEVYSFTHNFLSELGSLKTNTDETNPKIIQEAVRIITENDSLDSLRSAHELPESPFKWFLKDENNMFQGLRKDLTPEKVNEPRQNFPKVFNPNGHIDIVKASHVLNSSNLHGDKMFVFVTPNTSEIDTSDDFEYIEYQIDKEGSPLSSFFKG